MSKSCSVLKRQSWRDKQLLSRFSRWQYQQCREVKNEIKGKSKITGGFSVRGKSGDEQIQQGQQRKRQHGCDQSREGGILVAKARRIRGFDRISISGMENEEYISEVLHWSNSRFQIRVEKQQQKKKKPNLRLTSGSSDVTTYNKAESLVTLLQPSLSHSDNISLIAQS